MSVSNVSHFAHSASALPAEPCISIRSLLPLVEILQDQPALLDEVQGQFGFCLARPQGAIRLAAFKNMLVLIHARGLTDIGYRLGWSTDMGSFGVFDFYLSSCQTLHEALSEFLRLLPLMAPETVLLQMELRNDQFVLIAPPPDLSSLTELLRYQTLAAMLVRYLQLLCDDEQLYPRKTETPLPISQALASHPLYLGPQIQYGCAQFSISYDRELLERPLRNSNMVMRKALRPEVDALFFQPATPTSTQQKVRDWLASLTDLSQAVQSHCADYFGISESSLKRRLAEQGVSFSELLTHFRRSKSLQLLLDEQNKIEYIARMMGFSERAPFERAFRQWYATTPSQFRLDAQRIRLSALHHQNAVERLSLSAKNALDLALHLQQGTVDSNRLAAQIQRDETLCARVICWLNRADVSGRRCHHSKEAAQRLMQSQSLRDVLMVWLFSQTVDGLAGGEQDIAPFCFEALRVSQMAQAIATKQNRFSANLIDDVRRLSSIHNVGEWLLRHLYGEAMARLDELSPQTIRARLQTENDHFGLHRYVMAAVFLMHWQLPADLCRRLRALFEQDLSEDDPVVTLVRDTIELHHRLAASPDDAATLLILAQFQQRLMGYWQLSEIDASQLLASLSPKQKRHRQSFVSAVSTVGRLS